MKIEKVTNGYVEQVFEDGECVGQKFIANSEEADFFCDGCVMMPSFDTDELYYPFDMKQP